MRGKKKFTVVLLYCHDSEARKAYKILAKRKRSHLKIKRNAGDMKMSKPIGKISCNDVNYIQD